MAVRIGHASKDENGKAVGGAAGDQTEKEVCIRNWYNGGWGFLARPKDKAAAEKIASACESGCANENIGYDQNQRNTLLNLAKSAGWDPTKISTACEADCSSFVTCCVMAAGIQIWSGGNAPTTRTLRSVLEKTGQFDILTEARYISSADALCRGDILCKAGSHTVIVLDDGPNAETAETVQETQTVTYTLQLPLLKKGSTGDSVKALQILLKGYGYDLGKWGADGDFGSATENAVECFQEDNGLTADGEVGGQTWAKLLGINESNYGGNQNG